MSPPRYSDRPMPPYSYVPGHHPHPVSDPAGHMHGEPHQVAQPLQPDAWQSSAEFLFGVDLMNQGFYWEAHEAWESLWHAAGRQGTIADFLKGLIKLAAAGVKAREGNPRGVTRHATRAKELLSPIQPAKFCGMSIRRLLAMADSLIETAEQYNQPQPLLQLDQTLLLEL